LTSHIAFLHPERSTDSKTPKRPSELWEGCRRDDCLCEFDCLEGAAGALGPPLRSTDSKTPKPDPGLAGGPRRGGLVALGLGTAAEGDAWLLEP